MAYLIHFSTPATPTVERYKDVKTAQAAAAKLQGTGPRYVLAQITEGTLSVLTGSNLSVLWVKLSGWKVSDPDRPQVRGKDELITRLVPLIIEKATDLTSHNPEEENEMSEQNAQETTVSTKGSKGKGKAAKAPKATKGGKAAKAAPAAPKATKGGKAAKAPKGRGRQSELTGKKLSRVKGSEYLKRMRADSRRAISLSKIKDGMLYEDAIKAGAVKGDIDTMIKLGTLIAK